ncbi:MAG: DoxX family protein [Opitutales bacterium]|jgi:putative oxidoreductase
MNTTIQGIKSVFRHPDAGLLIIRVAVGIIMLVSGYKKLVAGAPVLHKIGANIKYLGLDVGTDNMSTLFFGVLAAVVEALGGLLLMVGFFYRTSAFMMMMVMLVATLTKIDNSGGNLSKFGYPMLVCLVLLGLLFTGPGRLSLQKD